MQKNGDHGKKITYLKLDIEQSEVEVLRELIDSEIFFITKQFRHSLLNVLVLVSTKRPVLFFFQILEA